MPIFVPPIQEKDLFKFLVENGGQWTFSSDNLGIERSIVFGTFKETRKFIEEVCDEAQRVRHHPEWANAFRHVLIRLTTHKDRETGKCGISKLDLDMATFCDQAIEKHVWREAKTTDSGVSTILSRLHEDVQTVPPPERK